MNKSNSFWHRIKHRIGIGHTCWHFIEIIDYHEYVCTGNYGCKIKTTKREVYKCCKCGQTTLKDPRRSFSGPYDGTAISKINHHKNVSNLSPNTGNIQ